MAGDPYFASVKLLMHMDDDGSSPTDWIDHGSVGHAITPEGNTTIVTDTKKFGSGSGFWTGPSNDRLSIPGGGGHFDLPGDFTLEGWINATGDGTDGIIGRGVSGNGRWQFIVQSNETIAYWTTVFGQVVVSTTNVKNAGWLHWAVTRENDLYRLFVNGIQEDSRTEASAAPDNSSDTFYVGDDPQSAGREFNGHMDDIRITQGVARYSANFTPPTNAFPNQEGSSAPGVAGANSVVTVLGG